MKDIQEIRANFVDACYRGSLSTIKQYIKKYTNEIDQDVMNNALENACNNNQIYVVRFLLTSKKIPIHAQINHIEYKEMGAQALAEAIRGGHIEMLEYLLTSPELKEHANISLDKYYVFEEVCARIGTKNQLRSVQYLSQFMCFEEYYTPHEIIKKLLKEQRLNPLIMKHLILERTFPETKIIKEILEIWAKKDIQDQGYDYGNVNDWFALRRLNQTLEKDLKDKKANKSKSSKL